MKTRFFSVMVLIILTMLVSAVAFAEKTEWKNKDYNAAGIKKIMVVSEIPEEFNRYINGYYVDRSCSDFLTGWCSENGIQADTDLVIEKKYSAIDKSYTGLKATNPEKAWDVLDEYTKSRYTAVLRVRIERYGYDEIYHEGYSYTVTEDESVRVQKSDGSWTTIKYPVKKEKYSKPYTTEQAVVILDLSLRDINTDEVIFARREERRSDGGLFSSPNPENVMKKICEGYIKDLSKMIKKN